MSATTTPGPSGGESGLILSVHMASGGPLRRARAARAVEGLRYAQAMTPADLGRRVPMPKPWRLGLVCAWDGDKALDAFLAEDRTGRRLAEGWHVRLQPLRASGSWSEIPELEHATNAGEDAEPATALPVDEEEPVAVLTLGRLRLSQGRRFVRASTPAEKAVLDAPGLLASTGMAKPPIVCTFSLWRSAAEMSDYAYGKANDKHVAAIRAQREKPFHKESIFARFRPYRSEGEWNGSDPFAGVELPQRRHSPV